MKRHPPYSRTHVGGEGGGQLVGGGSEGGVGRGILIGAHWKLIGVHLEGDRGIHWKLIGAQSKLIGVHLEVDRGIHWKLIWAHWKLIGVHWKLIGVFWKLIGAHWKLIGVH